MFGGSGGAFISHRGQPRIQVTPLAMGYERRVTRENGDRATFVAGRLTPEILVSRGEKSCATPGCENRWHFAGGFGAGPAVESFTGSLGVGGVLTAGVLFAPSRDGTSESERFFVRLQPSVSLELGGSDWGLVEKISRGRTELHASNNEHHLVSVLPTVQWVSGSRFQRQDVEFGLALGYRWVLETAFLR